MTSNEHYDLVARALGRITKSRLEQPTLEDLAADLGVSPFHLQRVFQAWAGVSPKQFLKSLTREAALERLAAGESVLDAALSAGLSGPGRLHDLLISTDALTPGEIRKQGSGVILQFGFGDGPFGESLVAWSDRGVNFLGFSGERDRDSMVAEMKTNLARADFNRDDGRAQNRLDLIFERDESQSIPVWLRGSPFQLKVWQALLAIPEGANTTYGDIAKLVGSPGASQAVGNAVGSNPVSWIIPCHRVIRNLGELGGYRWGAATKSAMIGLEAARVSP